MQGAECLRVWVLEPQSANPDPGQEGYLMQGEGASLTFPGQRQEREVLSQVWEMMKRSKVDQETVTQG